MTKRTVAGGTGEHKAGELGEGGGMPHTNFIFMDKDWVEKPIYRVFPVARFLQVLTTKKLTLVKPQKWDDPFENLLLNTRNFPMKDFVYGQCWSEHSETDAMWRCYSHNKDGVRIVTTPKRLLEALQQESPTPPSLNCFIGKVQYLKQRKMAQFFKATEISGSAGHSVAKTLLYKREAFVHEGEIRLIYCGEVGQCDSDIFQFDIDPNTLFDGALFDPRMSDELVNAYRAVLRKVGFQRTVSRSTLYDPPVIKHMRHMKSA